ncbi:isocitrate/isopropylmalate family dehydrogenase, partial [Chloroflexota bacterium]
LRSVEKRFHHEFDLHEAAIGFETWKATGNALPMETINFCKSSQGILLGATGAAQWEHAAENIPPGWGRRQLSREMGYCASVRPARVYPQLLNATPVKPEYIQGMDAVIVRETRWINKKHPRTMRHTSQGWYASDKLSFREDEILPILRFSFLLAQSRRKNLVLMAQTSIFQTSALWLRHFTEMGQQFPDVEIDTMAPDNCVMQLVRNPSQFDVIVCDSTPMGGMLNEIAGLLMGSIGMAPGASVALRDGPDFAQMVVPNGLYEPIHGSAPRRAGQGIANPIGTVLAAAMLLRYSLNLEREAKAIENAVDRVLSQGYRTYDIMGDGNIKVGTEEMGNHIAAAVEAG